MKTSIPDELHDYLMNYLETRLFTRTPGHFIVNVQDVNYKLSIKVEQYSRVLLCDFSCQCAIFRHTIASSVIWEKGLFAKSCFAARCTLGNLSHAAIVIFVYGIKLNSESIIEI